MSGYNYELCMAGPCEPTEARSFVRLLPGFTHVDKEKWPDWLRGPGVRVTVDSPSSEFAALVEGYAGFSPAVQVGFEVEKFAFEEGCDSLMRVCLWMFGRYPGDALLSFQWETVLMMRRGGRFLLDDDTGMGNSARWGSLGIPYEVKKFPLME